MTQTTPPRRRGLLAALGGATAASAAAAPVAAALAQDRADALPRGMPARKEGEAEKRKARYRETEHVRAFYQTNRY